MKSPALSAVLFAVLIAGWPTAELAQNGIAQSGNYSSTPTADAPGAPGPDAITPTEISAELGGCSALITVTGADAKPIFNAKVSTRIRYGLFGAKKLDLEVYTSASGQVKIVGLPESPKRPVFFQVSKGEKLETLEFTPDAQCRAVYDVRLK
jgi:hypothetical protein